MAVPVGEVKAHETRRRGLRENEERRRKKIPQPDSLLAKQRLNLPPQAEVNGHLALHRGVVEDLDALLAALDPGEIPLQQRSDKFPDPLDPVGTQKALRTRFAWIRRVVPADSGAPLADLVRLTCLHVGDARTGAAARRRASSEWR